MDVFVAYSSKDEPRVRTIVDWLRANDLEVWVAYELPAGLDWDTEIDRVLTAIPCVLTVWSQDAVSSAEVKGEARAAMARDALVTVSLDNVPPPRSFTHLHAVDLSDLSKGENSPRTTQLLNGIRAKLSPHVEPAASISAGAAKTENAPPSAEDVVRRKRPVWAYAGGALLVAGAIFMFVAGLPAAGASCDDPSAYRLAGQTFSEDTAIDEAIVCISDNATIRVRNGAKLTVDADTMILRGPAQFDGRGLDGKPGRPGSDGPTHVHKPPVVLGIAICAGAPKRSDYDGQSGERGGNGGPGAKILLRYATLQGERDLLKHDVSGGKAGSGGDGGRGGRATCRAGSPYDVKGRPGARGPSGSPGANGGFELIQRAD